jgi:hypothetical protein
MLVILRRAFLLKKRVYLIEVLKDPVSFFAFDKDFLGKLEKVVRALLRHDRIVSFECDSWRVILDQKRDS